MLKCPPASPSARLSVLFVKESCLTAHFLQFKGALIGRQTSRRETCPLRASNLPRLTFSLGIASERFFFRSLDPSLRCALDGRLLTENYSDDGFIRSENVSPISSEHKSCLSSDCCLLRFVKASVLFTQFGNLLGCKRSFVGCDLGG